MKVAIMTDTNSGISVEEGKKLGVYVMPMPVLIDGSTYYEGVNLCRHFVVKQKSQINRRKRKSLKPCGSRDFLVETTELESVTFRV